MSDTPPITELVAALYPALVKGDRETIERLVDPDFEGTLTEGLPLGVGGVRRGRDDMIDNAWWALGRAFHMGIDPSLWMPLPDGRLLVTGRYVGSARRTGAPLDAAFAHIWSAEGGRLTAVWQLTDSARFVQALEGTEQT